MLQLGALFGILSISDTSIPLSYDCEDDGAVQSPLSRSRLLSADTPVLAGEIMFNVLA